MKGKGNPLREPDVYAETQGVVSCDLSADMMAGDRVQVTYDTQSMPEFSEQFLACEEELNAVPGVGRMCPEWSDDGIVRCEATVEGLQRTQGASVTDRQRKAVRHAVGVRRAMLVQMRRVWGE